MQQTYRKGGEPRMEEENVISLLGCSKKLFRKAVESE